MTLEDFFVKMGSINRNKVFRYPLMLFWLLKTSWQPQLLLIGKVDRQATDILPEFGSIIYSVEY
jgi:hypothetical protein